MKTAADNYEDIIRLAHHVSVSHPQMPVSERAAQFSPFAALTGYEAAIRETERLTEARIELDEDMAAELDDKLRTLQEQMEGTAGSFCHLFSAGREKAGGAYVTVTGRIRKIERYKGTIIMRDGTNIPIRDVTALSFDTMV